MMIGMNIDGLSRLRSTLVSGSKNAYEMKKIDKQALYRPVDILCRLFCRPSILAFPMFVRSRKERRYKMHSFRCQLVFLDLEMRELTHGIRYKSSFQTSFRS
jgi:hypothetical protein